MFEDLTYNKKEKKFNKSFYELYNLLDALKILLNLNKSIRKGSSIEDVCMFNREHLIKLNAGRRCGKTTMIRNFADENPNSKIAYVSGYKFPNYNNSTSNLFCTNDVQQILYNIIKFDYIFMEYPSKGQVDKLLKGLKNVPYIIIMD